MAPADDYRTSLLQMTTAGDYSREIVAVSSLQTTDRAVFAPRSANPRLHPGFGSARPSREVSTVTDRCAAVQLGETSSRSIDPDASSRGSWRLCGILGVQRVTRYQPHASKSNDTRPC